MARQRTPSDDEADRQRVLNFIRAHPGETFEEVAIKGATGVNKAIVRGLLKGIAGVDQGELEAGRVRWVGEAPGIVLA